MHPYLRPLYIKLQAPYEPAADPAHLPDECPPWECSHRGLLGAQKL